MVLLRTYHVKVLDTRYTMTYLLLLRYGLWLMGYATDDVAYTVLSCPCCLLSPRLLGARLPFFPPLDYARLGIPLHGQVCPKVAT